MTVRVSTRDAVVDNDCFFAKVSLLEQERQRFFPDDKHKEMTTTTDMTKSKVGYVYAISCLLIVFM